MKSKNNFFLSTIISDLFEEAIADNRIFCHKLDRDKSIHTDTLYCSSSENFCEFTIFNDRKIYLSKFENKMVSSTLSIHVTIDKEKVTSVSMELLSEIEEKDISEDISLQKMPTLKSSTFKIENFLNRERYPLKNSFIENSELEQKYENEKDNQFEINRIEIIKEIVEQINLFTKKHFNFEK